jgi:hypothetical protein
MFVFYFYENLPLSILSLKIKILEITDIIYLTIKKIYDYYVRIFTFAEVLISFTG